MNAPPRGRRVRGGLAGEAWTFETLEARDAFLEDFFPNRKADEAPGTYWADGETNGDRVLIVFCFNVEVYPPIDREGR